MLREAALLKRPQRGGSRLTFLMTGWVRSRGVSGADGGETPPPPCYYCYYDYYFCWLCQRRGERGGRWAASSEGKERVGLWDERGARVKRTKTKCDTPEPPSHCDCWPEDCGTAQHGGSRCEHRATFFLSPSLSITFTLVSNGDQRWSYRPALTHAALIGFSAEGRSTAKFGENICKICMVLRQISKIFVCS